MTTYRVETEQKTGLVIEADYFRASWDGFSSTDAFFYVQKPVNADYIGPGVYQETLVAFVNRPRSVQEIPGDLDEAPEDD